MVRCPGPLSIKGRRLKNIVHHFKSISGDKCIIQKKKKKKAFNDTNDGDRCGVEEVNGGGRGGHL